MNERRESMEEARGKHTSTGIGKGEGEVREKRGRKGVCVCIYSLVFVCSACLPVHLIERQVVFYADQRKGIIVEISVDATLTPSSPSSWCK